MVQVTLAVLDGNRYVKGLPRDAFRVYEDGVQQPISHFAAENSDLELAVGIDVSGSMTDSIGAVKDNVKRFLSALRPADRAAGRALGRLVGRSVMVGLVLAPGPAVDVSLLLYLRRPGNLAGVLPGQPLLDRLAGHPELFERALDATPSFLAGLVEAVPPLATLAEGVTGQVLPPSGVPAGAGWLASIGKVGPWLRESGVQVRAGREATVPAPTGVGDLMRGVDRLDPAKGAPPGTVRVVAVTGVGGRRGWIVEIPGTQSWAPRPGTDPFDLTGNLHGEAGEPTAASALVVAAMAAAGIPAGDPVMLVGHSQGGIVAAGLACDPAFRERYRVTHLVVAGAPVAAARIPSSVSVLSLEHDHDLVSRLDGRPKPDRPGWVTVSRAVEPAGAGPDAAASHDLAGYAETADRVDGSSDPTLRRWRDGLAPFVPGPGGTASELTVTGTRVPG
jgi:hypothetical protein